MWVHEPSAKADLFIPEWTMRIKTGDTYYTTNDYTMDQTIGLSVEFFFSRAFTIHLMQTFFPSIMIALSSVASVFVPSDLVPGRMGLCITAFLSMISLFNGSRTKWPLTTYMKAMDYWTTGCYITVFTALIEYCVVLYLVQKSEWERRVSKHIKTEVRKKRGTIGDILDQKPEKVWY